MVFLVFLEVLEMSSEVVGPGPNTREIKSLRVDPGPLACALPPDAGCMLPFGLFVVCVGGVSSRGAVLAAFAPSWRCPQSSLFLFYKIQLSTGCRWYRCDSAPVCSKICHPNPDSVGVDQCGRRLSPLGALASTLGRTVSQPQCQCTVLVP